MLLCLIELLFGKCRVGGYIKQWNFSKMPNWLMLIILDFYIRLSQIKNALLEIVARNPLMSQWFMVTLVGKDQRGIVAKVTSTLYQGGGNLGEASMLRLGGNFTIMLMVHYQGTMQRLIELLTPVAVSLQLHLHVDAIEGQLHQHQAPNVRVAVYGADRAGIVAQVTTALANAGLDILDLISDVGGQQNNPFYIMYIEGIATRGMATLQVALQNLLAQQSDLEVKLEPIEMAVM
jgi:glycine cleavage system transcriptional repressor